MKTLRIFISSPGDVAEEREKARQVIVALQRQYGDEVRLVPVLWEDLLLPATSSFQGTIDLIVISQRIDIAVFLLWSRLGSPVGPPTAKDDGTPYRSGTEREFDLMLALFEKSGGTFPIILAYTRDDDVGFRRRLVSAPANELESLIAQRQLAESFVREAFHDAEGHNVRAYHSYREPVGFAQHLYSQLSQAINKLIGLDSTTASWTEAPYRSLEVFDIRHAPIFCGRDEEAANLLQRLRDQQVTGRDFVCIVGASGSGKSSLARAGVAATLLQRSFDDGVKEWRTAVFLPGLASGDLFLALANTLAEPLPELREGVGGIEHFARRIEDNREAAADLLEAAFRSAGENLGGSLRVIVILDQMEELWTDRGITSEQREKFLQAIEEIVRSPHLSVLATLRSDFYPQAQLSEAFLRMKGDRGHFDLTPPGAAALQEIIVQPAHRAGLRFERDDKTGRTLDQRILEDAARDSSALPLLQYALAELHERHDEEQRLLTFAAYEAMGGVEGALGQRAAQTFDDLPDDARAAFDELLPMLVSVDIAGGQNAVRRRAPLADLTSTPARRRLTDALIAARFLTTDEQSGAPVASLAHEALLRRWDRIIAWIKNNREILGMRARIEQSQTMWEESRGDASRLLPAGLPLEEGRRLMHSVVSMLDEKSGAFVRASIAHDETLRTRAATRRRIAFAVLGVLTMVALAAAGVAWKLNAGANEQLWKASRADHRAGLRAFDQHRIGEGLAYLDRALDYRPMNTDAFAASVAPAFGLTAPRWHTRSVSALGGSVSCMAFSPDGRRIAAGTGGDAAQVIDAATGKNVCRVAFGGSVLSVAFSPDNRHFAAGSADKSARIIEVTTGKEAGRVECGAAVNAVDFSPDGRFLAVVGKDKIARVIEAATGREMGRITCDKAVSTVDFSPDGLHLAVGGEDETARIIMVATVKEVGRVKVGGPVNVVVFSPDGGHLAVGSGAILGGKGAVDVVEVVSGKVTGTFPTGEGVKTARYSPDGRHLAAGSWDKSVRVLDPRANKELSRIDLGGYVNMVDFSPDGRFLVATGWGTPVRVLDTATSAEVSRLEVEGAAWAAAFSADGRYLAIGCSDTTVRVLEATTGKETNRFDLGAAFPPAAFSADGRRLADGSLGKAIRVTEAITGHEVAHLQLEQAVLSVALDADGGHVAAALSDKTVRVFEVASHREISRAGMSGLVMWLGFDPEGRHLATIGLDNGVRVIDAATAKDVCNPQTQGEVRAVSFSPDGRRLAVAGAAQAVKIFAVSTGAEECDVRFDGAVGAVSFSPDGRLFAAGGTDMSARIIDAATGKEVRRVTLDSALRSVRFSSDGRHLLAVCADKTARFINVTTGSLVRLVALGRQIDRVSLTPDGRSFMGSCGDATARLFDCQWMTMGEKAAAPWRAALLVQAGCRFRDDGVLAPLSGDQVLSAHREVGAFVGAQPAADEVWQHSVLKWTQMPPETRTTSPWTDEPLRTAVGRWLTQARTATPTITDCADQAPWHPLAPVSLARLEPQPDEKTDPAMSETTLIRPRFLARLTLDRLRKADETLYGRDTLADYAAWSAKIMHRELHLDAEALEALAFALERAPPKQREQLLEFQEKLKMNQPEQTPP